MSAGPQTLEIATREPQIQIDKIAIGTGITQPTGTGAAAINCTDEPNQPAGTTFFELECAEYGSAWTAVQRPNASGGMSLLAPGAERFINSPPTDDRYLVRFPFTADKAGTYRVFVRTVTSGGGDDSMWIRMGGGKWYKWNRINFPYDAASSPIWSQAGEWTRGDFAVPVEFNLSAGSQTIEIARRESGIEIDKLAIGLLIDEPTGSGGEATNCQVNSKRMSTSVSTAQVTVGDGALVAVYPNPVGDRFNLQFSGRLTEVTVLDGAGRIVRRMDTDAEGSFAFYRDRLARRFIHP